jgi:hypothetical protein
MLGLDAERRFERFFHGPRPSHGELLSFAGSVDGRAAGWCPLCRFPTVRFRGEGEGLDLQVERDPSRLSELESFPGDLPAMPRPL